jgi:hypothetical protein
MTAASTVTTVLIAACEYSTGDKGTFDAQLPLKSGNQSFQAILVSSLLTNCHQG